LTDQGKLRHGYPTGTLAFDDGSGLTFHGDGRVSFSDVPAWPPLAYIYYWQILRGRPDVATWEEMREAEKGD
jgi:hypothetical protein